MEQVELTTLKPSLRFGSICWIEEKLRYLER